jgi:hypothetical protein
MERRRVARFAVIGIGVTVLAACGDDDATSLPSIVDVPDTVAMGVMPQQLSDAPTLPPPPPPPTTKPSASSTSTLPSTLAEPIEAPLGALVDGDRILLIGDSILASAAPRNGGELCDALVLFGWQAEIDAVADRGIDFAAGVLDARLIDEQNQNDDWDVVALSFGSDVDGNDTDAVAEFGTELGELIERVTPRPVLLYTLAGGGAGRSAVNNVIRAQPQSHHNVLVVDFADAGGDGVPIVDDSGRALTDDGMKRFSIRTAAAAGESPGGGEGTCLPSEYGD